MSTSGGRPRSRGRRRRYPDPARSLVTTVRSRVCTRPRAIRRWPRAARSGVVTTLVYRDGACAHLVVVAGRCPSAPNEAMASQRTVGSQYYGFRLGVSVGLGAPLNVFNQPMPDPSAVRIVGVYRAKDTADPFWFGQELFAAAIGGNDRPNAIDSLFVDAQRVPVLRGRYDRRSRLRLPPDDERDPAEIRRPGSKSMVTGLLARHKDDTAVVASSALPDGAQVGRARAAPGRSQHPARHRPAGVAGLAGHVSDRLRRDRRARQRNRHGEAAGAVGLGDDPVRAGRAGRPARGGGADRPGARVRRDAFVCRGRAGPACPWCCHRPRSARRCWRSPAG